MSVVRIMFYVCCSNHVTATGVIFQCPKYESNNEELVYSKDKRTVELLTGGTTSNFISPHINLDTVWKLFLGSYKENPFTTSFMSGLPGNTFITHFYSVINVLILVY